MTINGKQVTAMGLLAIAFRNVPEPRRSRILERCRRELAKQKKPELTEVAV